MELNEFQKAAAEFVWSGGSEREDIMGMALGIAGEAGEVADKVKKIHFNLEWALTEENVDGLKKELGDLLWYVAVFSKKVGLTLDEIAEANIAKLAARSEAGTLKGDGDNR